MDCPDRHGAFAPCRFFVCRDGAGEGRDKGKRRALRRGGGNGRSPDGEADGRHPGAEKPRQTGVAETDGEAYNTSPGIDDSAKELEHAFASSIEQDIMKQTSNSLMRGIKSLESQVMTHKAKIEHPERNCPGWESFDPRYQNGLIRHWNKEIDNWNRSIHARISELERRGEHYEG